jgi:hypothetical protein
LRFAGLAPGDYVLTATADTDTGRVTAGRQKVTLPRSGTLDLPIDPGVRAVRFPPLEPVD